MAAAPLPELRKGAFKEVTGEQGRTGGDKESLWTDHSV